MDKELEEERTEKIVNAAIEIMKIDSLYEKLLEEKAPEKSELIFKKFLFVNKITEKEEIQEVWARLKEKHLFDDIFEYPGMEPVWQKMKKEFDLKGWVFRSA